MAAAVSRRHRGRAGRETISFYLFVSPWLIGFLVLGVFPLVLGLTTSFTNYDGFNLDHLKFVGFGNYVRALTTDNNVMFSAGRTVLYTFIRVPLGLVFGVALALMLNQALPFRSGFRTLSYLPHVIPIVATAWVWKIFADQNYGLLNGLISVVRPNTGIRWLVDYPTAVLIALTLWAEVGSSMVIFLAGLQGVPNELKEASRIDGAGWWQVFRAVTLPLLTPVIFFELILGIIGSLQVLVAPMLLAPSASMGAMPPRDNYFFLVHVYQEVFVNQLFGYGTALLWLLFLVVVILSLLVFRSARYWVYYEVDPEAAKP